MWIEGDHTVYYCPRCKQQRTFHRDKDNYLYWYCGVCDLWLKSVFIKGKLDKLILP